jgi:hypothetical protein
VITGAYWRGGVQNDHIAADLTCLETGGGLPSPLQAVAT